MDTKYAASFQYSDQELLDLYREAAAGIVATGARYRTADGREWEAARLPDIQSEIVRLETKLAATSSSGPVPVIARMVRS